MHGINVANFNVSDIIEPTIHKVVACCPIGQFVILGMVIKEKADIF